MEIAMTRTNLRFLFASALALSLTSAACRDPDKGESASATDATTSPTSTDATVGDTTTTATTEDVVPTTSVGDTTTTTTTTGPEPTTGDTTVTTGPVCNDEPNQPINSSCTDNTGCGCDTGKCFVVPALGGFCGECLTDDDCDGGGCSVPNPLANIGATCNQGGPGEGCMSNAVCSDPDNGICGTLLSVPGIITVSTCGQCSVNADCTDPALPNCTPTYDVEGFKGKLDCVADGSVDNNFGCSLEKDDMGQPVGNKACKSGFCGTANIMALLKLGVCGECNDDSDCPNGKTCTDPAVDLGTGSLIGSVCM
jgi:hypothetical protein